MGDHGIEVNFPDGGFGPQELAKPPEQRRGGIHIRRRGAAKAAQERAFIEAGKRTGLAGCDFRRQLSREPGGGADKPGYGVAKRLAKSNVGRRIAATTGKTQFDAVSNGSNVKFRFNGKS